MKEFVQAVSTACSNLDGLYKGGRSWEDIEGVLA